ncbi:hypothetical protein [Pinibacter soli]|uniref:Cardiolipin synthase N-terminal domain-containing protein n=1 Tax=Pinibacter soli TaxID=3044211 RepID=A0ABT6RC97_9BACT|nr:hypothetical protein [Pinibacter soli]MDI3320183.1 hypothetical protein [Pinibacter soli]
MNFGPNLNYIYYITVGLQAICALHCIRKGNQNKWLYIIIFLPIIGSLIYFFGEIFTKGQLRNVQSGMDAVIQPTGSIRRLEEQLKFTDTFDNRVALADAYLATGQTEKAIELYERSHTGVFTENEHLLSQMIVAYYKAHRDEDIIPLAQKLYKSPQFPRSQAHLLYAIALANTGKSALAEKEFKTMSSRFSCFEQRYNYGLFLIKQGREEEAESIVSEMLGEASHLSSRERRDSRQWFAAAKDALKSLEKATS